LDSSKERALQILAAAFTKNALQPVLLHVTELSSYTDYILVLSARSVRQVEAISEVVQKEMKGLEVDALGVEGKRGSEWVLADYGDVVVHIFHHPLREKYDLEGLWSGAEQVELEVPEELRYAPASYSDEHE